MAIQEHLFFLREEGDRRWCQDWEIAHEHAEEGRIPRQLKGRETVGAFSYEASVTLRPVAYGSVGYLMSDPRKPMLDKAGRLIGWGVTLCLSLVAVQAVTKDVFVTSRGPWYRTMAACESSLKGTSSQLAISHLPRCGGLQARNEGQGAVLVATR